MAENNHYRFLEPRPDSRYRALFVKGRRLRAEVLYRQTVGEDPRSPEETARDYGLPLEVVEEAIRYCVENEAVLNQARAREDAAWEEYENEHPSLLPPGRTAAP